MAIVEIAWFKSTKAYQDDHSLLNETARRLKQFSGVKKYVVWLAYPMQLLKGVYSGCISDGRSSQNRQSPTFSIVRSSCGNAIHIVADIYSVWESYDHYIAAGKEEEYAKTFSTFQPALEGTYADIKVIMVPFTSGLEQALGAPVTEIVLASLQQGKGESDLGSLFESIASTGKLIGHHWGPVRQKENYFALIVGWKSVKVNEFVYQVV